MDLVAGVPVQGVLVQQFINQQLVFVYALYIQCALIGRIDICREIFFFGKMIDMKMRLLRLRKLCQLFYQLQAMGQGCILIFRDAKQMDFFIAPAAVVIGGIVAAVYGVKKRHAVMAMVLGLMICVPAMLTLWVNLSAAEGFKLLGFVEIPELENFLFNS